MGKKLKKLLMDGGVLLGGCMAAMLLFEGGVRLFTDTGPLFKISDPAVYFKYAPNMAGTYISDVEPSVRAPMRINSLGYRGPEWNPHASPWIAFLGDSFTVGREVPYEQTFVALIQKELAKTFPGIETRNFAVDASGTGMQVIHLEKAVLPMHPSAVVLQMYLGNDFVENSKTLNWRKYYPYWRLDGGKLVLDAPEQKVPFFMRLARYSRGVVYLYNAYRRFSLKTVSADVTVRQRELYREHPAPAWEEAYRITLALLQRAANDCRAAGCPLLVMIIPDYVQTRNESQPNQDFDAAKPQERICAALDGKAGVLDLAPFLKQIEQGDGPEKNWTFPKDGHPNAKGHLFFAETLIPYLKTLLLRAVPAQ